MKGGYEMPRKAKGIHSSPKTSGVQNMPDNWTETHKDDTGSINASYGIWEHGLSINRENYQGLWTEESLGLEISEYFKYCYEHECKPNKAGLCLWLNLSKQQFWEWENNPSKFGFKTELTRRANLMIEDGYVNRLESFPTGNIFLLKSSHGYAETTKVEVTGTQTNTAEVADAIARLGLDK
jgi:hypothetical protein